MDTDSANAMRNLTVAIWAKEAVCCPVCKIIWTAESVENRGPKVANVDPRVLVCPGCWARWLELCRWNVEQAIRTGQLAK